jgi:signal transduction histidine kinase
MVQFKDLSPVPVVFRLSFHGLSYSSAETHGLIGAGGLLDRLSKRGRCFVRRNEISSPSRTLPLTEKRIATAFLLALLALAAFRVAHYKNMTSQIAIDEWVAHTQQVRAQLGAISATLSQTRLDQRDYLLTADRRHADLFDTHHKLAEEQVAALRELVKDNPSQSARALELQSLVVREMDGLERSVSPEPGRARAEAAVVVAEIEQNKSPMASTVGQLEQLEAEERRLLQTRASTVKIVAANGLRVFVINTIFVVLLLSASYGLVIRYVGQRNRAHTSIDRLNEDLRRKAKEWEAVFEMAPVGIVVADDPLCQSIRGNALLVKMLGERDGRNLAGTAAVGDRPTHRCFQNGRELAPEELPMQIAAATGVAVSGVEIEVVCGNQTKTTLCGSAVPLFDEHGRPRGAIGVFWDIAQFREVEERLIEERDAAHAASVATDDYLATVSHDLRTPIGATLLWASLIKNGGMGQQDREAAIDLIVESCKTQSQLVEDILDLSRIAHGKLRIEKRPVELMGVVQAACATMRAAAAAKGIALIIDLGAPGVMVEGDSLRLQQVLWNLVSNAVKFTPERGEVRLTLTADAPVVRVEVTDTGIGIEPALLTNVFERFYQSGSECRTRNAGIGLGLSIAKHLVDLHGGTLCAQSNGPGQGATFTLVLPVHSIVTVLGPREAHTVYRSSTL